MDVIFKILSHHAMHLKLMNVVNSLNFNKKRLFLIFPT